MSIVSDLMRVLLRLMRPFVSYLSALSKRHGRLKYLILLGTGTLFLLIFLFVPLCAIFIESFWICSPGAAQRTIPTFTLQNYKHFFEVAVFRHVLIQSLVMGVEVTVITLLIGYIPAYYLAKQKVRKELMMILLIVPFWTSFLIRCFSWVLILMRWGFVNFLLMQLGFIHEPIKILHTTGSVILGFVHVFLPYMIFPIYVAIDKIEPSLIESAKNLGADDLHAWYEVTLPLSMPGIVGGCLLTFILTAGSFLTPLLLGSPSDMLIMNIVLDQFLYFYDWPLGSAMSVIFLATILAIVAVFTRIISLDKILGL